MTIISSENGKVVAKLASGRIVTVVNGVVQK